MYFRCLIDLINSSILEYLIQFACHAQIRSTTVDKTTKAFIRPRRLLWRENFAIFFEFKIESWSAAYHFTQAGSDRVGIRFWISARTPKLTTSSAVFIISHWWKAVFGAFLPFVIIAVALWFARLFWNSESECSSSLFVLFMLLHAVWDPYWDPY